MKFATILIIVIIGYIILYVGMIVYDLFFKNDLTALMPKPEDEDIDISDEAGKFQPILIEKERPAPQPEERPVVDEPPEPLNKGDGQAPDDKPPKEEDVGDATTDEAVPHVEPYNGPNDKDVDDDLPKNRKPLSEVSTSEQTSFNTQKGNVNVSSDPDRVKELVANLRRQSAVVKLKDESEIDKEEPARVEKNQSPAKESDLHSPSRSEQTLEVSDKAAQPQAVKPKAASGRDLHTQTEQPKATTVTEDYRTVLHMRVHINEEAKHTRFSDFMTAEELSNEVKKASEDPEELALREIENGWRLCRVEKENEELEAMMANGQMVNNAVPNVTIETLSKN